MAKKEIIQDLPRYLRKDPHHITAASKHALRTAGQTAILMWLQNELILNAISNMALESPNTGQLSLWSNPELDVEFGSDLQTSSSRG
jgi:hypothetical protein